MGIEAIILGLIFIVINYIILYHIIKTAVKNGKHEYDYEKSQLKTFINKADKIAKTTCKVCLNEYDIDYPKCPHCNGNL